MPSALTDKARELWSQVQGATGDIDPAILAAAGGAVGGGALGMLSGSGGRKKGKFGRVVSRGIGGALLGAGAGAGGMLLKKILDDRDAKNAALSVDQTPVSIPRAVTEAVTNVASPLWNNTVGKFDKVVTQGIANFGRDIHSTPEQRAARKVLGQGDVPVKEDARVPSDFIPGLAFLRDQKRVWKAEDRARAVDKEVEASDVKLKAMKAQDAEKAKATALKGAKVEQAPFAKAQVDDLLKQITDPADIEAVKARAEELYNDRLSRADTSAVDVDALLQELEGKPANSRARNLSSDATSF